MTVFKKNTPTIDMFGSGKYRKHVYGAEDDIAVVHTEKVNKHAATFITSASDKSSDAGQFSYAKNFYGKDADNLVIKLREINHKPN